MPICQDSACQRKFEGHGYHCPKCMNISPWAGYSSGSPNVKKTAITPVTVQDRLVLPMHSEAERLRKENKGVGAWNSARHVKPKSPKGREGNEL